MITATDIVTPATSPADTTDPRDVLASIGCPADVRRLPAEDLPVLAEQVRALLIDRVTATGGHLGASLGTVELTIALHRVFRSPRDVILFDTGHQTYPHKVLTGRAGRFNTLRQAGGLSGYPSRVESPHDWTENSHASVALAWADGIAKALALGGEPDRRVVAVIGDGALTGGVAWEGLNTIGGAERPVIVVLNDNGRSYDPTIGGLAAHLARLRLDLPRPGGNLFQAMGLTYLGPVNGHDIDAVCGALRQATTVAGPCLVHVLTVKGRGYPPAEADDADRMHACGVIDPATGMPVAPAKPTWTDVFADEIIVLADQRPDVVALTAAMRLPTGLGRLSTAAPDRVFDSGIAEQHLLASAAGLATAGRHPVVCVYSAFLNRAYDQLLMDIALHRLPVTLVLDRAGITGPDGASHHGMWDLALLSTVPGMRVACPRDPARLRELLHEAARIDGPTALRFPKATIGPDLRSLARVDGVDVLYRAPHTPLDVLVVAVGALAPACLHAADILAKHHLGVTVVDPRWVHPINPALLGMAARHQLVVCVEDGIADAGVGARLAHATAAATSTPCRGLGLPTAFIAHGSRGDILAAHGLSGPGIADTCLNLLLRHRSRP
ncbi:1-deoxy-D-xylulose-5-phosphate synthase [Actinocrispum wychmicini]|uniref:1-deoxy-D-xylulose-5-phosphate synthase n=1 Tax=Actinocrispum wychmicini TaxID=1213861 RepID=A0A4R2IPH0_9PSEU|nr:1-deoxy-D-xylulose-5-phosphate synthase [Actinocrispum wychmicini]TCO45888.1 1-deoxy-D-xylulose-5-phosphate synthase [Actinocrispum wychmicini]